MCCLNCVSTAYSPLAMLDHHILSVRAVSTGHTACHRTVPRLCRAVRICHITPLPSPADNPPAAGAVGDGEPLSGGGRTGEEGPRRCRLYGRRARRRARLLRREVATSLPPGGHKGKHQPNGPGGKAHSAQDYPRWPWEKANADCRVGYFVSAFCIC